MNFSSRLKDLRLSKGLTQMELAEKINLSKANVSKYESGVIEPNLETLNLIAELFDVSLDYLFGNTSASNSSGGIKIPVLGEVRAGIPLEATQDILDWEEIPEDMARQGDYFALKVKGDSMEPKISEGDVVIVKKQNTADTGDIVIALVNGDEATIKKLRMLDNGLMLIPTNPAYDPIPFTKSEIVNKPVSIIGKVVELRAKF